MDGKISGEATGVNDRRWENSALRSELILAQTPAPPWPHQATLDKLDNHSISQIPQR